MKTLRLRPESIHQGSLILVNAGWSLKEEPKDGMFVPVEYNNDAVLMDRQAARILTKILSVIECSREIAVVSGYRTMSEQQRIYDASLLENGIEFTRKYVALPGCSEHQTGLAVDLAENSDDIDSIRPHFPYFGVCQQFREKAVEYGFIERYPAGKEHITQIAHEPWHFRFVGYPHSKIMTCAELTLEEYTDYLRQFAYHKKRLKFSENGLRWEIGFLQPESAIEFEIPQHMAYQLSGNNVDGVVVTLWELR
jgi:D-alanyl-D-alanine dipeptidase/carboxypeptidase